VLLYGPQKKKKEKGGEEKILKKKRRECHLDVNHNKVELALLCSRPVLTARLH